MHVYIIICSIYLEPVMQISKKIGMQCVHVARHLKLYDALAIITFGTTGLKLEILESFRLTFMANVKPLTKFLILQLYYNSFYTSFEIY
jgi:hypothetical protein